VWNFFADSNHNGVPEGELIERDRATDERGELVLPDGDIEYAMEIHKPHWSIAQPRPKTWPWQCVLRGADATLHVVMRPHARQPLRLAVTRGGNPVGARGVVGCVTPCSGACCGEIGRTDASGLLTIDEFYPEEYDRLLIGAPDDPYYQRPLWQIDPRALSRGRRLNVVLPGF
jgi:hypothetical protein